MTKKETLFHSFKMKLKLRGPFSYQQHGNIVLHKYRAIYFFIPKVASSSLKLVFSELLEMSPPDAENCSLYPHKRKFPFVERDLINSKYSDYFKFCLVRNPYSRLLSCYKNKIHPDPTYTDNWYTKGVGINFRKYGSKFIGGMSFEKFVDAVASISDDNADDHILSQHKFITDNAGNLLVDHMGKFENFHAEIEYISKKAGFPKFELPHSLQTGVGNEYKSFYTKDCMNKAKIRYAKDLELFGYNF